MVLRPGFEPGSPAFFLVGDERPEYLVLVVFNLAILGRAGAFSFLLPEPTGASCKIPVLSF